MEGLLISCIGVFIALIFLLMILFLQQTSNYEYKIWDIDTITAADFTVTYAITKEVWENFKKSP